MSRIGLVLVGLLLAASASAQTGVTITALTVQVYNSATPITGTPTGTPQTAVWPQPAGTCGLTKTPPPVGNVINPQFLEIDDPANPALACRINFGVYFSTFPAASNYKATATFTYSDGLTSARSAATNFFDLQAAHGAPTTVGVR